MARPLYPAWFSPAYGLPQEGSDLWRGRSLHQRLNLKELTAGGGLLPKLPTAGPQALPWRGLWEANSMTTTSCVLSIPSFFFFLVWIILKVFIEFTVLLLFYVLVFWPRGMWDLSSLCTGRWSPNHWTTREVPVNSIFSRKLFFGSSVEHLPFISGEQLLFWAGKDPDFVGFKVYTIWGPFKKRNTKLAVTYLDW